METRVLLVRHGETELSVDRRYSGHGDVPLTALGERQAAAVASRLAISVDGTVPVVSSPLRRARRTAAAIAEATGGQVEVWQDLIEVDFGAWEGLTFAEAAARNPELHSHWRTDPVLPAPNGESFAALHRRMRQVRDELVAHFGPSTVVVVSHAMPIKSLLGLRGGPAQLERLDLGLASLSIVEFSADDHRSVHLVNDTSHLRKFPTV
jgi:probable phosphoglycerate mutase